MVEAPIHHAVPHTPKEGGLLKRHCDGAIDLRGEDDVQRYTYALLKLYDS